MKHVIIMPDLGQTTSEAKIVSWLKNPGDKLAMGEPLLEVETDKATMDVEAYVGGYLRKDAGQPRRHGRCVQSCRHSDRHSRRRLRRGTKSQVRRNLRLR